MEAESPPVNGIVLVKGLVEKVMKSRYLEVLAEKNSVTLPVSKDHQAFVQARIAHIFGDLIRGFKTLERALEDCYIQGMYDAQECLDNPSEEGLF